MFVFHWAALPFDAGVHADISMRLNLGTLWGGMALKHFLENKTAAAVTFTTILALLFAFYFLSLRMARKSADGKTIRTIVFFIVIFATMNLLFYPWLSQDIFQYGFYGKAVRVYGANPMTATVHSLGDKAYGKILYWQDTTAPYGPLTILFYAALYFPGSGIITNAWSHKLGTLAIYCLLIALITRYFRRRAPSRLCFVLILIGWNPLVLLEAVANAHNDIIPAMLLGVSSLFLIGGTFWPAILALTAAGMCKYTMFMLAPLSLGYALKRDRTARRRAYDILMRIAASCILIIVLFLPFWAGKATFSWVGSHVGLSGRSFHWMAVRIFERCGWPTWPIGPFFAAALAFYAIWLSTGCREPRELIRRGARLLIFYWIFCCFFNHPWYLLWALPLVALAESRAADTVFNACCFFSMMGYYPFLYLTRCEDPRTVWWMSLVTLMPSAAIFIWKYRFTRAENDVSAGG